MATHSSILAWKIPWTEEPSWLQSMGWPQRVRHDRVHSHMWWQWLIFYSYLWPQIAKAMLLIWVSHDTLCHMVSPQKSKHIINWTVFLAVTFPTIILCLKAGSVHPPTKGDRPWPTPHASLVGSQVFLQLNLPLKSPYPISWNAWRVSLVLRMLH